MTDIPASLNKDGQLASTTTTKPPITVNSALKVDNLNVDKLDDLDASSFLRTDANSSLNTGKTLTVNGTVKVGTGGTLKMEDNATLELGWFKANFSGSIFNLEYNPN